MSIVPTISLRCDGRIPSHEPSADTVVTFAQTTIRSASNQPQPGLRAFATHTPSGLCAHIDSIKLSKSKLRAEALRELTGLLEANWVEPPTTRCGTFYTRPVPQDTLDHPQKHLRRLAREDGWGWRTVLSDKGTATEDLCPACAKRTHDARLARKPVQAQ